MLNQYRDQWAAAAMTSLLIMSAIGVFSSLFMPGLPTGHDLGSHYYLALEKYALIAETGYWDGLLPQWYAGFSPFSYYPDLFYLLFACSKFLLASIATDITLFKLVLVAVFYLPIIGSYFLTCRIGASRRFACLAALLTTSVSVFSGTGFQGHFQVGLVNQTLGLGLYLFCLTFFMQWQQTARLQSMLLSACFFVLITQTHIITLVVTMLSLALLASWNYVRRSQPPPANYSSAHVKKTLVIWLVPLAISVGSLAFRVMSYWDEQGGRSAWSDIDLFKQAYAGEIFSTGLVNMAALALVPAACFFRKFRTLSLPVTVIALLLLGLGTGYFKFAGMLDIFNSVFRHRAWGFAGVLAMVLTGSALSCGWHAAAARKPSVKLPVHAMLAMIAVMLAVSATKKILQERTAIQVASSSHAQQTGAYDRIAARIRQETPGESVVLYELGDADSHQTPFLYLASSLAVQTRRVLIQGQQIESSRLNFDEAITHLKDSPPDQACGLFQYVGATHFLAWTAATVRQFRHNPCFSEVMTEGHFHLFAYRDANYTRLVGDIGIADFVHSRHRYSWLVQGKDIVNLAKLGFSYHPRFHVAINGKPVGFERTEDNFIGIAIPPGESRLTLEYRIPAFEKWLSMIDKALAAAAVLFIVFCCCKKQPARQPASMPLPVPDQGGPVMLPDAICVNSACPAASSMSPGPELTASSVQQAKTA